MVKITVFREDNQPVLHLQRRQSASASHFEKTILPVLKKTILLEKTILPFPLPVMQYQEVYSFYRIQVQCTFGQNIHDICIVNEVKDSLDPCNS